MNRFFVAFALVATLITGRGGGATSASSCVDYASDLRERAKTASSEEISRYIDDTAEQVAKLISADPESGEVCATAVLEALFSTGIDDLFSDVEG